MRRIVMWLAATVTIVVLLFGYHTSTNKTTAATIPSASPPDSTTSGPSTVPSATSPPGSSSPSASKSSAATTKTYTGSVADTRWGPVQVEITVRADTITDVTVLQQPSGNRRDQEINDYALPILIRDTVQAQSANIDMVSGATITSEGYLRSLQAALDEAGI